LRESTEQILKPSSPFPFLAPPRVLLENRVYVMHAILYGRIDAFPQTQNKWVHNPTVKEIPLPKQLLSLKKKTSWSWERMCREFHRVMGEEGPSHTTLFRYASGRVKRPHVVVERYVQQAIDKVTVELNQK